jgi:hypothetical protein
VKSTSESTDFSVPGWKKRMSAKDLAEVQGILDATNFVIYQTSMAGPVPEQQDATRTHGDLSTDMEP